MTVLGAVYVLRRRAEDLDTTLVKKQREVVRYLSACRDDDALRILELYNVQYALKRELVEVETV